MLKILVNAAGARYVVMMARAQSLAAHQPEQPARLRAWSRLAASSLKVYLGALKKNDADLDGASARARRLLLCLLGWAACAGHPAGRPSIMLRAGGWLGKAESTVRSQSIYWLRVVTSTLPRSGPPPAAK